MIRPTGLVHEGISFKEISEKYYHDLDPENEGIQLDTVIKAAHALGKELRIELI